MGPSYRRPVGPVLVALLLAVPLVHVGPLAAPAAATTAVIGTGECAQQVSAAGDLAGAVTVDGDDCLVAFKGGSGAWIVPEAITSIRYLVVGGGGGGGSRGGGGAGALFETTAAVSATPGTSIAVAVGAGGTAGTAGNTSTTPQVAGSAGGNGTASVFDGVTAYGGGGGTSTRQYDPNAGRNALPDPPEGTDLTARPVFTADFTLGEGGSGGGGQASPEHNWFTSTNASDVTQLTALGTRGGAGRPAGTAGTSLFRNGGGNSRSIFHRFDDGRVRTFWIGAGGGGAGAPGGDVAWASSGESVAGVVASNGQVITLVGPGFVPGAGGAGRASTLLSSATATALTIGQAVDGAVYFAGGGAGTANYHSPREVGEAAGDVPALLTERTLVGFHGVGGGGGGGAENPGRANTGGGGRGGAVGGSGVVLVRYSRVAQTSFTLAPTSVTEDAPVTLDLTGGSGSGDVTITLDPDGPCTLTGTTLSATGTTGSCTVTVTKTGDASYLPQTTTFTIAVGDVIVDEGPSPVPDPGPQGRLAEGPTLVCSPDPVRVSVAVTCVVDRANPDTDIFWTAALDGVPFAGEAVRTGADGIGTFVFRVPGDALGRTLSVELVGWSAPLPLGVVGAPADVEPPVPTQLNTGGGPMPLVPSSLLLLLAVLAGTLALVDRGREVASVVAVAQRARARAAQPFRMPGFDALDLRLAELRDAIRR